MIPAPESEAAAQELPPPGGLRGVSPPAVLERMGARLCYGEPVKSGQRTVIPVARVFSAGGFGYGAGGEGDASTGEGGGGGGVLDARPIGYIEVGADGSRFHAIKDPDRPLRVLKVVTAALTALAGTAAGRRAATAARGRLSSLESPRLRRRRGGRFRRPG